MQINEDSLTKTCNNVRSRHEIGINRFFDIVVVNDTRLLALDRGNAYPGHR